MAHSRYEVGLARPRSIRTALRHFGRFLASHGFIVSVVLVQFVTYSLVSLYRHLHFGSGGYDLGIFDQAAWLYSHFKAPLVTVRDGSNLLGDHFSPILVLLAPLYWLFPNAETLLVVQALLLSLSTVPVYLYAKRKLPAVPAALFTCSYALYWGLQQAVAFDFHEIAFAVPALAWALYAIEVKAWRSYAVACAVLLLTKEDMGLLVATLGIIQLLKRQWKAGLASILAGIGWFLLALKVLIPHFNPNHGYNYWTFDALGADPGQAVRAVVRDPSLPLRLTVSNITKIHTLQYTFRPFAHLNFFSPASLLLIPLIEERMLSSTPGYWSIDFHYTATISPVLAITAIDAAALLGALGDYLGRHMVRSRLPILPSAYTTLILGLVVLTLNLRMLSGFPLSTLDKRSTYASTASDQAGYAALANIPPTASVSAMNAIIPHLSDRQQIYQFPNPSAEYMVASSSVGLYPFSDWSQISQYIASVEANGSFRPVFQDAGWIVLEKTH